MAKLISYIQQKKKVNTKYNPDTFRVISDDAECSHPKYPTLPYRSSFEPPSPAPLLWQWNNNNAEDAENTCPFVFKSAHILPPVLPDHRRHKPQPTNCGFLEQNVRTLNEPICSVYTAPVHKEEKYWWPSRANPGELHVPLFREDTHYRIAYNCRFGERASNTGGRYAANKNREPALGTVPVNYLHERNGTQRLYKESMSYEHMYDSRADPNYPIRGKRHGAFVWKKMDPISQRKFTEYFERLAKEESSQALNGEITPLCLENGVHVIRSANHKMSSGQSSAISKSSTSST